jgi:NADPH:quinone reductase-like Zn-dependent oxidoreductase
MSTLRAVVLTKYGLPEVLKLQEVERPTIEDHQMLIRVHATSVTPMEYRIRSGKAPIWPFGRMMMGFRKPKRTIIGGEMAGEIVEVGKDVQQFQVGNRVFGFGLSTYADYIISSERATIATMPPDMRYEEGASIPFGGITSTYFLKTRGNIQSGQRVLINGASGGVGVFATQLAKHYGTEVTGVCSTKNVELVQSLGADRVIDYTKKDFTKEKDERYDIVFDAVGMSSYSKCKKLLTEEGVYLTTVPSYGLLMRMLWTSKVGKKKAIWGIASGKDDLLLLKELFESKKLRVIIDRTYPLEDIVEAHTYVEKGHKVGSVVITLNHSE